jgi:hypothetical protein
MQQVGTGQGCQLDRDSESSLLPPLFVLLCYLPDLNLEIDNGNFDLEYKDQCSPPPAELRLAGELNTNGSICLNFVC